MIDAGVHLPVLTRAPELLEFVQADYPPVAAPLPLATLKGELIVRGSRTRLPGGTVRCDNLPDAGEAISDDDGFFSLTFPAGMCKVNVSAGGFHTFVTDEELEPNEIREV